MLRGAEFTVGSFPEADANGLTMMLPRRSSDEPILITFAGGEKVAVYLGQHKYNACPCGDSEARKGLLIAGVEIEVDEGSLFDPEYEDAPPGSVVRADAGLSIVARMADNHNLTRLQPVALVSGLSPCRERSSAGFRKWQVVLGDAEEKRVLFAVDLTTNSQMAGTTN
ncbi:MAG: hypothetical protein QOK17_1389 [Sphingomonadales bacterium]|nr:hypothetical protein [Sphingomonadales bacterium]